MNCRQVQNWMDGCLDEGGGSPPALVSTHLRTCRACAREWKLLLAADAALRVPQPAPVPEQLLGTFRERLKGVPPPVETHPWAWLDARKLWTLGTLSAAAAAVFVVVNLGVRPDYPLTTRIATGSGSEQAVTGGDSAGERSDAQDVEDPLPQLSKARLPARPAPPADHLAATQSAVNAPAALPRSSGESKSPALVTPPVGPRDEQAVRVVEQTQLQFYGTSGGAASREEKRSRSLGQVGGQGLQEGLARKGVADNDAFSRGGVAFNTAAQPVPALLLGQLRKEVTLTVRTAPFAQAVQLLAETASIELKSLALRDAEVTVTAERQPVWMVLEDLARQAELEVAFHDNALVLREQLVANERLQEPVGKIARAATAGGGGFGAGQAPAVQGPTPSQLATGALPAPASPAAAAPGASGSAPAPRAKVTTQQLYRGAAPPPRRLAVDQTAPPQVQSTPKQIERSSPPAKKLASQDRQLSRFTRLQETRVNLGMQPARKPDRRFWPVSVWGELPESEFQPKQSLPAVQKKE